jgi:hypothetical protein
MNLVRTLRGVILAGALISVACSGLQEDPGLIGRDCKRIRERLERLSLRAKGYERISTMPVGHGGTRVTNREAEAIRELDEIIREVRSRICH